MRTFEILTALSVLLTFGLILARRPARWMLALPVLALLALAAHLALEGYRWQMLPLYLLAGAAGVVASGGLSHPEPGVFSRSGRRRRWAAALGLVLLVPASVLPVLLPVPALPAPTGPYPVGTRTFSLVDAARAELYSGRDEPRAINMQVWYPAAPAAGARPGPWIDRLDLLGPALAGWLNMPAFFVDHLALARTHTYPDAPLAGGAERYPVLLFSHGWTGLRVQNTSQVTELASQGFIVVAPDHTYGALATAFPDGRVAFYLPSALPVDAPVAQLQDAGNRLVNQWAGDLAFLLDTLEAWNAPGSSPFAGRLDLERVGALGHSTGGGAIIEFCARDDRCRAGLAMDAYLTPVPASVLDAGLEQPFFFLFSERWPSRRNNLLFDRLWANRGGEAYRFTILGSGHYDFTDLPALTPLSSLMGYRGTVPVARTRAIVNAYGLAFFRTYLLGEPTALPEYSEVVPK